MVKIVCKFRVVCESSAARRRDADDSCNPGALLLTRSLRSLCQVRICAVVSIVIWNGTKHFDELRISFYDPFLTGVRPSEQLALLWEDVDLQRSVIRIRRTQEPNGSVVELTKTAASSREIPISALLQTMLEKWRGLCPVGEDDQHRVFPLLGRRGHKQHRKRGRTLAYTNFLYTYWRPALSALQLPIVTPHSARHAFISALQAHGVEVGLVAKLAGHANATVTLSHYTQAVRGGQAAVQALEEAYRMRSDQF